MGRNCKRQDIGNVVLNNNEGGDLSVVDPPRTPAVLDLPTNQGSDSVTALLQQIVDGQQDIIRRVEQLENSTSSPTRQESHSYHSQTSTP